MRKQLFSWAAAALSVVALSTEVQAQAIDLIGGARFKVVAPANLAGSRRFTYSYTGTAPWGGDLSTPIVNVQVIQAIGNGSGNTDSLLCSPAANGTTGSIPSLAGKVAIFYRGNCTFSSKAFEAQAAGAVAAIIINNIPGEPAGMAATAGITVTIPVFQISDVDGAALMNSIRNGIDTRVTFTKWGSGLANDIAVISNFEATYHGGAIPRNQLDATNGNPKKYRMYAGDVAANFGTDTSRNMVLRNEISWTPTGGATTVVHTDTAQLASLAPQDSVDRIFNTRFYNPHATSTGIYTIKNTLTSSVPESDTVDDVNTYQVYVTDSIYCKTQWDATNMRPAFTGASRLASGAQFSWGPLFYTAVGGDYPAKMQFTLAREDAAVFTGESATAAVFKFNDGANGNPVDGIFQDGELAIEAVGYKAFGPNDTARYTSFVVDFDPAQLSQPIPALVSNSTYWYAISPSLGSFFIATNGDENSYMRGFISTLVDSTEYIAPQFTGGSVTLIPSGVSSADIRMIPFTSTNNMLSDTVSVDQTSGTPAMSVHVSSGPLSVRNAEPLFESLDVFPNPAKDNIQVRWSAPKSFGMATITVFNGVGQQVMNHKTFDLKGEHSFSLANLASGSYWVVFATEKGADTRQIKVIK